MRGLAHLSDSEVIEIVRNKNNEAYAEIIKRYQTKLMRYANYLVNDWQLAADIVQEGFIKAYINLHGFDTKRNFSSWIYRIVHNEAVNALSKRQKQISFSPDFEYDSGIDLEDNLIREDLIRYARHCLGKIPVIYREPLSLFYLEEKTYEEISDILRIPIGTVSARINRAKVMLKKICQKP